MEIIPSVSTTHGLARSLPAKLERLVDAEDGLRLSKGEKKKIRLLMEQLKQMSEYLMDPSEVEFPASAAKCWLVEVRELSYDIDDFHDELVNKCQTFQNNPHRGKHRKRRKRWISSEVSRFRIRLEKAIQRYKTFSLHESKKRQQSSITCFDDEGPPPPLFGFEDACPIGMDDSVDKVENWLTDEGEPKRRVVAIVGLGGVGKTTLANKLYCSLRKRFQCRAFVRSSQMPDMRELLTSILLQVRPHMPPDVSESCNLTNTIRTHLQQKKYFIVIDGLWALSTWDLILQALPDDDNCFSRILTTTEVDAVAHRCCGHISNYMLRMEPLSKDRSRDLFFSRFVGKQPGFSESSPEITSASTSFSNEISSEILSKCGGFPLAIVSIASLLANQPQGKMEKWKHVWSSLSSNLKTNPTVEGMKQVLSLCYNSLPDHLKTCMLYLSIYKQGHVIRKDDLVKQWIAEGFICAKQGKGIEEVASTYFDELVTKGMIQPVHNSHNGQVISCTVHYMILELIQCKSTEENFVITIHHSETNIRLADKVRRLSLHFGDAEDPKLPDRLELSQVRTLAFYGVFRCMPSLAEFRLVRVIILDLLADQDHIKLEIPTFCKLVYLEIACNVTLMLQIKLRCLQYLETLKIDSRRCEVPQNIVDFRCLLHLSVPGYTNLPNCIGHMSSLRTLGCFNLSSSSADNVQSLDKLTGLRDLHLTCSTILSDNLEENFGILSSVLPKLNNLKSLTLLPAENSSSANILGASSSDKNIPCDHLLTVSPPPGLLEKLELSPRICIFSRLPGWIGDLGNLSILKIAARELSQSEIDTLNSLPALSALLLYVSVAPSKRIVLKEGFRVLKHFKFICSTLCLAFEKGAMPSLQSLKLGFNTNRSDHYSLAEAGFGNLKRLSAFSAKIGFAGALEQGRLAKSALVDALRSGERQPIINIHLVDRVFGCDEETSTVGKTDEAQTLEKADVIITGCGGPTEPYETGDKNSSPANEISRDDIRITLSTDCPSTTGNQAYEGQYENTRSENKYHKTEELGVIVEGGDSHEQPATQNGSGEDTSKHADSRASVAPTRPFSYMKSQAYEGQYENTRSEENKYHKTKELGVIVEGGDSHEQPATQNGSGEDTSKHADSRAFVAPEHILDMQTRPFSYMKSQELATSLVVAPLVSLLKKKVSSSLLDQYNVMEGMEKHHKTLMRLLPAILDVITDAEKQASRRGVKQWLEGLKMAAYEANDVFDEFEYEVLHRQAKKNGHIAKLGIISRVKLFPNHNCVAFHVKMGYRLRRIVDTFKVLVDEMNTFGFNKLEIEEPAWKELHEMDSIFVDKENIVGRSRDDEKKKIVNTLVNGHVNGGELMVIPIVGMGGLGKTTLAQLIYNDPQVKERFQLLKWVCVSDDFNVCNLANKICNASETVLEEALKKLQEHLRGKRYLLVLDDVWNKDVDKWEKLKACLKHGFDCAVLVTTRDTEIAQLMGTIVDDSWITCYHELAILGKEYIQEIIETRAFSLKKSKSDELVKLVGLIAERCVGSPLAAKAIGSVLRNKSTKEEWEDVLQRSAICDDETGILPILKLSYNDLPIDMKQCFAFCALYPKDYQIDVDKLIQLWMANGFISDQKKVPAETIGKWIVDEMVSRSFFQYKEQSRIGYNSTTFVNIHDLMHDVALSASEKECVCITDESIESGELLPSAARHILCTEENRLMGSMGKMFPSIQTMMIDLSYDYEDVLLSSKYSSLRALSIPGSMSIKPKHLCHLRYLDLSYNYLIEALPDDISILYSLQTLRLSGCSSLKRLFEQMKHMSALRHLYTDGCTELECMPPELGRLTSLRTITCFVVGSGLNCSSIGELKDLNIGGSLMLKKLENVTGRRDAKAANLKNKKELRQLSLEWTSGKEEEEQCHEVLESLKAHDGLLALEIYSYQGTSFPSWMGMLKNIVELRLSNCTQAEQLPPLCQLAGLQLLHLEGLGKLEYLCSICTSSTFGKLKDLKLVNLPIFDGLCEAMHGGVVAFPQLEILHIEGCKNLAALPETTVLRQPHGGGHNTVAWSAFPELKKLTLKDLCSFERWEVGTLEIEEEPALFPSLEIVGIEKCPKLTTLPRAPKLKELGLREAKQISLGRIRYMTSLSSLSLQGVKLVGKEEWDHPSSVVDMKLYSCSLFFKPRALSLWVCYGQLQDLGISSCNELVYWPEKIFQSLISLRRLQISNCNNLIGYAAGNGPDQPTSGRSQLLPHIECLEICWCESLVEVFNSPSLKSMVVSGCCKLESLCGNKQLNQEASSSDDVIEELSPLAAPNMLLPSSLESLRICHSHGLSEIVNLPSSLRKVDVHNCSKLRLISGQLDALKDLRIYKCPELRSLESLCIDLSALEELYLHDCISLASLPSGPEPQEYSSLCRLIIWACPGMKLLPSALQQRLDSGLVRTTNLDYRHKCRFPRLLGRIC